MGGGLIECVGPGWDGDRPCSCSWAWRSGNGWGGWGSGNGVELELDEKWLLTGLRKRGNRMW